MGKCKSEETGHIEKMHNMDPLYAGYAMLS